MQKVLAGNFLTKNWNEMKKEIDKIGLEIQVGAPIVIDSYNLNDQTFTYIMLTRYELEGNDSYTIAMAMNGMLVNKRLIWMAYYLNYVDESTITELRTNSNEILTQMMENN